MLLYIKKLIKTISNNYFRFKIKRLSILYLVTIRMSIKIIRTTINNEFNKNVIKFYLLTKLYF